MVFTPRKSKYFQRKSNRPPRNSKEIQAALQGFPRKSNPEKKESEDRQAAGGTVRGGTADSGPSACPQDRLWSGGLAVAKPPCRLVGWSAVTPKHPSLLARKVASCPRGRSGRFLFVRAASLFRSHASLFQTEATAKKEGGAWELRHSSQSQIATNIQVICVISSFH